VYQKNNPNCLTTICNLDIDELDIQFAKDIKIENNCGKTGLTTAQVNEDGTQSNEATSTNKIDCQMTDWSECSTKCSVGTKTREKITGPFNGGKPCGPLVEKCGSPCKTLQEQLQNGTFNFNDLDKTNKIILIIVIVIIITYIV
jgi:hypothetical protein